MGIFSKTTSTDTNEVADKNEVKTETKKKTEKSIPVKAEKTVKTDGAKRGKAYNVLVKPLITEKAGFLGHENKYVFEVSVDTNKIEVGKAIEEVYGIKPVSVNIMNREGKVVRRGRATGKRKDWKKAIVELPKGKTINIYEGV